MCIYYWNRDFGHSFNYTSLLSKTHTLIIFIHLVMLAQDNQDKKKNSLSGKYVLYSKALSNFLQLNLSLFIFQMCVLV